MLKIVACFVAFTALLGLVSGSVSQCYHCNSYFCGDTYNAQLGAVTSCTDLYKNAKLYSSRLTNQATMSGLSSADWDDDIETLTAQTANEHGPNARIFDIKRIFWDIFNKGEIDEYTEFVCVKVNYNESSQTKTYRGCVPKATKSISTACEFVNQKVIGASTGTVSRCHTCNTNLCNSGVNLGTSLLVMGLASVFKALL